jgi:hypothetical protein
VVLAKEKETVWTRLLEKFDSSSGCDMQLVKHHALNIMSTYFKNFKLILNEHVQNQTELDWDNEYQNQKRF